MTNVSFIYLSFGNANSYRQTLYSIYTLFGSKSALKSIYVITDQPSFFEDFLGERTDVSYIRIDKTSIREMRGEIDFVHRMKIASIEKVMNLDQESDIFFYLDSDTFIVDNLNSVTQKVSLQNAVMHKHEFKFPEVIREVEDNPTRQLLLLIRQGVIQFEDKSATVTLDHDFSSWNAGVLGLHRSHKPLLDTVYKLTDAIYTRILHHAAEQFSFSYILQRNTHLHTCEEQIFHYWPAVQKGIAGELFTSLFTDSFKKLSFADQVPVIMNTRVSLSASFGKHYLLRKDRAIQYFNKDRFLLGFWWSLRAVLSRPFGDSKFIFDILYHTRRMLTGKKL